MVVTGASGGIGRAAALRFARRGAHLVLAARGEASLRAAAGECRAAGAEALEVPTDVTDEAAVARLAERAVEVFGGIDVWVNNAAVIMYGRFDESPAADYRRVIETNLFGQIHGARAAVPHFRRRGSGVLVNVASVWGRVGSPYVSAYVTSKYAVRGFSACLRLELRDCPDVHVVTVLPQAVDTPIFDHGANHHGRGVRPIPPILDPHAVAEEVVRAAEQPRDEVTVGRAARLLIALQVLAPPLYRRLASPMFVEGSFTEAEVPRSSGNLYEPLPARVDGGWRRDRRGVLRRALLDATRGLLRGLRP